MDSSALRPAGGSGPPPIKIAPFWSESEHGKATSGRACCRPDARTTEPPFRASSLSRRTSTDIPPEGLPAKVPCVKQDVQQYMGCFVMLAARLKTLTTNSAIGGTKVRSPSLRKRSLQSCSESSPRVLGGFGGFSPRS